jgi:predicted N-acyltransferase
MPASGTSHTVRVLDGIASVPAAAWDALVGQDSSPFVEHAWLDALEVTGCVGPGTGWSPAHLSVWRGSDLVAAAPAYWKAHSEGEFVFDWSWAGLAERVGSPYYPKLVVAVPFTPATGDRALIAPGEDRVRLTVLLAEAARSLASQVGAGGVHVLFPRADEGRAWEAAGYLRREGFQFHWFRDGARDFDGYLARLSSKERNQARRELRGVESAGITASVLAPGEYSREVVRRMYEFYARTIDRHGVWGRLYLRESFFERVVERFRERLAWVVAKDQDGEVVAGAFNVRRGDHLYGRYWGASVDVPFLHFVVCYYAGIRYCIEQGIDVFEPGAGGEHKRARGFVPTITRSAHWLADPRLRAVLAPWLEQETLRVRALAAEAPPRA